MQVRIIEKHVMMRKERRKANALGHLDTALVDDEETDAEHLAGCGGAHMLNRYEVLLFNDGNVKEERRKKKEERSAL